MDLFKQIALAGFILLPNYLFAQKLTLRKIDTSQYLLTLRLNGLCVDIKAEPVTNFGYKHYLVSFEPGSCMGIYTYRSNCRYFQMKPVQNDLGIVCDTLRAHFNCDTFVFLLNPESFSDWQEKLVDVFSNSKKYHSYLSHHRKVYRDTVDGDLHYPAPYNVRLVLEILNESHFLYDLQKSFQVQGYRIIKLGIDDSVHQDYVNKPSKSIDLKNIPIPCPLLHITIVRP